MAYLDRGQREHETAVAKLGRLVGTPCTTSAVITEAMHLMSRVADGPVLLAEFVQQSGTVVYDYTQPPQLNWAAALMKKYADTPMDFADATLVLLADQLGMTEVATFDRKGFLTYQTARGKRFHLLLN